MSVHLQSKNLACRIAAFPARNRLSLGAAALALSAALLALMPIASAGAAPGLLFHASFDDPGEEAFPLADAAAGERAPRHLEGVKRTESGRFGAAAYVPPGGRLAYDAVGNVSAQRGTLAFWVQPDAPLFSKPYRGGRHPWVAYISDLQTPSRGNPFLRISVVGPRSQFFMGGQDGSWRVSPRTEWQPGEWHHVAIAWDAARGRTLFLDGEKASEWEGALHRFPGVGFLNFGSQVSSGVWGSGAVDLGYYFDEVYVFDFELDEAQVRRLMQENRPPEQRNPTDAEAHAAWKRGHFSLDADAVPETGAEGLAAHKLHVERIYSSYRRLRKTARILTRTPMDGMDSTGTAGEEIVVRFDGKGRFNFLRVLGGIEGEVRADGRHLTALSGAERVQRVRLGHFAETGEVVLDRDRGAANHLDFYELAPLDSSPQLGEGAWWAYPRPADWTDAGADRTKARAAAYYGTEEGAFFTAEAEPGAEASAPLAPWRFHHFVTGPLPKDAAIDRILLDLRLEGAPQGGTVVVRMYDPVTLSRRLLEFEARFPSGAGARPVRLLFESNDFVFEAGRRLWFAIMLDAEAEMALGPGGTRLGFEGDLERHGDNYLAAAARVAADRFVAMSEPQPWRAGSSGRNPPGDLISVGELFALCEHVLHFRPRERTTSALYSWMLQSIGRWAPEAAAKYANRDPLADLELAEPGVEGPEWAVLGREALKATREYVNWWVDERQDKETGQMGGGVSDDTCLVTGFVNFALIGDPGGRLREGVRRLADHTWEVFLHRGLAYAVPDGSGARQNRVRDHLHTYEEGTNVQHLLPRLYYGDPEYVERLMITSQWYEDHLTGINPDGQRLMRSANFSASHASPPPGHSRHAPYDPGMALILMPGRILTWYNRSPAAMRVLLEWMDAWLHYAPGSEEEVMRRGYFGRGAIEFETGRRVGGGPGSDLWYHLFWAYDVTRDPKYLEPVLVLGRGGRPVPEAYEWFAMEPHEESLEAIRNRYGGSGRYPYLQWRMSWEPEAFWEELRGDILDAKKYLPVHTWVGQSTDRIRIPDANVARMYLGGLACRSKRLNYHFHAVSWEGADDDVARFVTDKGCGHLKVLVYSFHDAPQDILMRVWQLDPGRYRVRTGIDETGDQTIDRPLAEWEQDLWRYEGVALAVPPKQTLAVEIERIQGYDWRVQDHPDLGINPRSVSAENNAVEFDVHNIGSKDSPGTVVQLRRGGRIVAEQPLPPLRAPNDLEPSRARVRFEGVGDLDGLEAVVNPGAAFREITMANNVVRFQ